MCGNRVEELEARVKELEASIEGLTDELVECKVRLRELESAVDDDLGFQTTPERADSPDPGTEAADRTKPEADEGSDNREEEAESGSESEIIVA